MAGISKFKRKDFRQEKAMMCIDWYFEAKNQRADWEKKRQFWWKLYSGEVPRANIPWEGASDVNIPLIPKIKDNLLPRYMASFFDTDPVANLVPVESNDIEDTDTQEKYLHWSVSNQIHDYRNTVRDWIDMSMIDGTSIMKQTWAKEWRQIRYKYIRSRVAQPGETVRGEVIEEPVELEDEDYLTSLFKLDPAEAPKEVREHQWKAKIRVDNRYVPADIEIVRSDSDDEDLVEIYACYEDLVYNAPRVEWQQLDRIFLPYRAQDIQRCKYVEEEIWLSLSELQARRELGQYKFTSEEWQELVEIDSPASASEDDSAREADQDVEEGISGLKGYGFQEGKFLVLEVYCFDDINDDYKDEHMVYTVVMATSCLCRYEYLEEQFPHGRRPYAVTWYKRVPGRFYGRSLCQDLAGIQLEVNALFNLTNDRELLINNPFFFFEPATGQDPNQYLRVSPGQGIPVGDASKIVFPNWAKNPVGALDLANLLISLAEDWVGMGPMQSGQRRPGATPRTARGTSMVLAEGSIKVDDLIKIAREGFKESLYQIFGLHQEFMPEETYFRVTGEKKKRKIAKSEMRGRFDFIISGNTTNTNREIRQNRAAVIYTTLRNDPLYQSDPGAASKLIKLFLRSYDDGDLNIHDLQPNIPVQLRTRTPDEVIASLIQGIAVEPRMGEDPMAMAQALDQFASSPEFELVPQEYVPLFANAVQAYTFMGQLMEAAQSQAATTAQQPGRNLPMASPGMSTGENAGMPLMGAETVPPQAR